MPLPLPNQDKIAGDIQIAYKDRVITTQFGDGYRQVTNDGRDSSYSEITITMAPLDIVKGLEVTSFLDTVATSTPFYITLPNELTPITVRLTKDGYDFKKLTSKTLQYSVSFNVREYFV